MSRGTGARAKRLSRKRGLGDISESVKEQLDDQEEDFKASFQPEKGGTWEFSDEDDGDLDCWGDFPLLQVDMSCTLVRA
jgi:hypothetical protein